ncbi:MAG: hypothetical protein ABIQ27_01460 [Flavobacterium sp.]|uniref:hypothetical protein n=1 Tax=Flavobacterium sp. TaxID=239 RepID=UPI003267F567
MKKIAALTLLLIITAQSTFAQNNIAVLKYEEAEEAYSAANYELTISKLKEVETMLKTTNPKILYLRISAQSKIIEGNPFGEFAIIGNTKKLAAKYLADYSKLPNNEEKYKDIYKISEKLKSLPNTIQEFETQKKQYAQADESRKLDVIANQKRDEENFMNFVYNKEYKMGLTLEETINAYPLFKKHYKIKNKTDDTYDYVIARKDGVAFEAFVSFFLKNNRTIGYYVNVIGSIYDVRTENDQVSQKIALDIVNTLKKEFNFDPIVTTKETPTAGYSSNSTTDYTWKKNNKTFFITHSRLVETNGQIHNSVSVISMDQDLAKGNGETPKKQSSGLISK